MRNGVRQDSPLKTDRGWYRHVHWHVVKSAENNHLIIDTIWNTNTIEALLARMPKCQSYSNIK